MGLKCPLVYTQVHTHIVFDHLKDNLTHVILGEHASLEKTDISLFSLYFFFSFSTFFSTFSFSLYFLPVSPSGIPLPPLSSILSITISHFSFQRGCSDNMLNMWEYFSGLLTFISCLITKVLKTKDDVGTQSSIEQHNYFLGQKAEPRGEIRCPKSLKLPYRHKLTLPPSG